MTMTQTQFEKLVKELDRFAHQHPQKYKLRVKLLANLGYAYIIFIILFPLGLAGVLIYFGIFFPLHASLGLVNILLLCLGILPLAMALILLKSLKVYFPKPKGLELTRQKAPKLFQFIDELTSTLKAPKLDHILLTGEFNAGAAKILSFLKPQENYLLLGLPLMCTLSIDQFRAVIAHELGHLSRNHSQLRGQIYLVRQTWYQAWERLQETSRGSTFILNIFLNWYAPFLYAYSFVIARADEYEADSCAREIAGTESSAEALIALEINNRYIEKYFWNNVYKQAHHQASTPDAVYTNLINFLSKSFSTEAKVKLLDLALDTDTNYSDTHPCLSKRLTHIGYNPVRNGQLIVTNHPKVNAAQNLLNSSLESFISHFNQEWQRKTSIKWYEWYNEAQDLQMRMEHLERQAKNQPLEINKAWELANLIREFKGDEAAISKFKAVLDIDPMHSNSNYAIGSILLEQGNSQGISYIETAIERDYNKVVLGCELVRTFMRQQGNFEVADCYRERGNRHYPILLLAQEERSVIRAKDEFISHNLSRDILRSLSRQLSDYPQIKKSYIVQKALKYFPEEPLYVLGVVRHRIWYEEYTYERDLELLYDLGDNLDFPYSIQTVILGFNRWKLKQVLSRVPKSKIAL